MSRFLVIALFFFLYVIPHILSFKFNGIQIHGDIFLNDSLRISSLNDAIEFFIYELKDQVIFFSNPIFIFFLSAVIFQKVSKWVKETYDN